VWLELLQFLMPAGLPVNIFSFVVVVVVVVV
jgi:hypothetical protein